MTTIHDTTSKSGEEPTDSQVRRAARRAGVWARTIGHDRYMLVDRNGRCVGDDMADLSGARAIACCTSWACLLNTNTGEMVRLRPWEFTPQTVARVTAPQPGDAPGD